MKELINQRYWCIFHLASQIKSFTIKSIDYLIGKSTGKKKRERICFLVKSSIVSCTFESDDVNCDTKTCSIH